MSALIINGLIYKTAKLYSAHSTQTFEQYTLLIPSSSSLYPYLQTVRTTDSFKMAGNWFMSREEFDNKIVKSEEVGRVLRWLELKGDTIYNIRSIEERFSVRYDSPCWILSLIEADGSECKVWGPGKLIADIKERRRSTETAFIMSRGQENYNGKTFNKYDLSFRDVKEHVQIFRED